MTKLYYNEYYKVALLIDETNKTYKVIKGKLQGIKALFTYKSNLFRLKELYNDVKSNYSLA